jgi:hypothetical protein
MKIKSPSPILSIMLYIFGVLIGFTLVLLATWSNVEAQFYGFYRRASNPLPGLRCPILMTDGETTQISLRIKNTTDKPLSPNIRMEISRPGMLFLSTQTVKLQPGESKTVFWAIGPDNIDLGHFIFAETLVYSFYPIPERQGICGIYILNLPGRGGPIVAVMILLSLLGMGAGLYGLHHLSNPSPRVLIARRPLLALVVLMTVSLIVTIIGWWGPGLILLILFVLLTVVTLVYCIRG